MQYIIIEREALAVVKYLAEIKYLIQKSNFLIKIYINHQALETIMTKKTDVYGQIA